MFSALAVEPTMSVKRTVTSVRSSVVVAGGASAAAHARQNFAISGLSWPQFAQIGMPRVSLGRRGSASSGRFSRPAEPVLLLLLAGFAGRAGLELLHDRRIGQRRRVAKRPVLGDIAKEPAHDLPGTRLRQLGREDDVGRPGDLADLLGHVVAELLEHLERALLAALEGDE